MSKGKLYDFKISFVSDELGIYKSDIEGSLDEAKKEFPTLEQAEKEMAKELGIKVEYLAPDGMAETKYFELVEAWFHKWFGESE